MAEFNAALSAFGPQAPLFVPSKESAEYPLVSASAKDQTENSEYPLANLDTVESLQQGLAAASLEKMSVARQLIPKLMGGIKDFHTKNLDLGQKLITLGSQERQLKMAHQALVDSLFQEIAQMEEEIANFPKDLQDIDAQTEKQLAEIELELAEEERLLALSTEAQIEAIKLEAESNWAAKQAQENERFIQELLKVRKELDQVQAQTQEAITRSQGSVAEGLSIQARVDGPNALNESQTIITDIQNWALGEASYKHSLEFQKLLNPSSEQLNQIIKEARELTVKMHLPSTKSSENKE